MKIKVWYRLADGRTTCGKFFHTVDEMNEWFENHKWGWSEILKVETVGVEEEAARLGYR